MLVGNAGVMPPVTPRDLRVNDSLTIPVSEMSWAFTGSGGPGGQHANTSNTRVEVRFDVRSSPSLSSQQRATLLEKLGPDVRVVVSSERSQSRNRSLALERLAERLAAALLRPRKRVPTRKTKGSQKRRLDQKSRRSQVKQQRRRPDMD
jgi:ribosome-associated protein